MNFEDFELISREEYEKAVREIENKYNATIITAETIKTLNIGDKVSCISRFDGALEIYEFLCIHPDNEKYCFLMDNWTKEKTLRVYIPDVDNRHMYLGYNSKMCAELSALYHYYEMSHYIKRQEA